MTNQYQLMQNYLKINQKIIEDAQNIVTEANSISHQTLLAGVHNHSQAFTLE